jgi:uncharacterized protein (TIGR03435 family)
MKRFAASLSGLLGRPVVDMTGLSGGFNINLEWTRDETGSNVTGVESQPPDAMIGPTIYTALSGVGLKLESRKAPVDILVIDRGEKVPTEN